MYQSFRRRDFLKIASFTVGSVAVGNLLAACGENISQVAVSTSSLPAATPTTIAAVPTTLPAVTATPDTATTAIAAITPLKPTTVDPLSSPPAVTAATSAVLTKFPTGFLWGSATSSYQIEGATKEDGRGLSIWDTFCEQPGKVRNGDTGDVACDHYHRYEQDLDLLKTLDFQNYRFSVAWPRILPNGSGQVNQKGLDFYKRLVEGLLKRNIRPMVTLYHWDLPQALQDRGGWLNRDTAKYFAEYADVLFQALGPSVPQWITHNEPWVVAYVGHAWGSHAPGLQSWSKAIEVTHTLLLSHGLAVQAFRAANLQAQVGITLNLTQAYPATKSAEDKAAAARIDGFQNRWFLDPLLKGGAYPADMQIYYEKKYGPMDYIQAQDQKIIGTAIDFLGINYYSPAYVAANPRSSYFETEGISGHNPVTAMGWEIVPQSLYDLLVQLKQSYADIPLYVTENGAAFVDSLVDSQINDGQRLKYLYQHIASVQRAIAAGVNLKGYFAWSLMDNFEWAEGYTKRFGLVYVDYPSQKRVPKRSALWFRDVIRQNGLAALPADLQ